MEQTEIGRKLRSIRENGGHGSIAKLAKILGVDKNTLQGYETGRLPDIDFLATFAEKTNCDFNELLQLRLASGKTAEARRLSESISQASAVVEEKASGQAPLKVLEVVDAGLMGEIVVKLEQEFLNSPLAAVALANFMRLHRDQVQALITSLKEPDKAEDIDIAGIINVISKMWIRYAGTEAGVAAYIYNKVFLIADKEERSRSIDEEVKFFVQVRTYDMFPESAKSKCPDP